MPDDMNVDKAKVVSMTPEYAAMIAQWKYDGVYAFYDHKEEDVGELLDGRHFACIGASGELLGFYAFGSDARVPTVENDVYSEEFLDIGLGLCPDLCGQGLGTGFILLGLQYAQVVYQTRAFRLSVAAFNERAIKVYWRAGFRTEKEVTNSFYKNKFYVMTCLR